MKVCIVPTWNNPDKADGGIRRVVEAQQRYLPEFDVQVTPDPKDADLIACHGAATLDAPGVPMVCHNHGAMWEDYRFGDWGDSVNAALIDSMVRAQAITAPSKWVAHAISRGMLARPEVVYHGVDADEWAHNDTHMGYVLWNKARVDPVSDPADMLAVAKELPNVRFLSTFGNDTANVMTLGAVSYSQMRTVVQRAGVYLATARETFGIGTLEALAAGVPIAGWDYGGQSEIVIDGETGHLAPFGDVAALADCVRRCLADRSRLSANAVTDARARWQWKDKIAQYAAVYQRVYDDARRERPRVSVVITAYNLERYLPAAVESVQQQTMTDWELLIVDDCSTDKTKGTALELIEHAEHHHPKQQIKYLKTPHNLGLSGARNYGWQHAKGRYILFLDADDLLENNALDTLSTALDREPAIHIAYGSLDTIAHDGTNRKRNPWPAGDYDWRGQIAHLNQLPYCAMMRREVLERSGGYRIRDWRAEDAAFWARVTSFGFRAAKVTDDATLIYRMHDGQKSRAERREHADIDGDWTAFLPWRLANSQPAGAEAMKAKKQPNTRIVPFGAQGKPPTPAKAWPVRHYQHPAVSVIIPVGPGHAEHLIDALDSVQAQTMVEWEAIVVDDGWKLESRGGDAYINSDVLPRLKGHPWAQCIATGPDKRGAGAARNIGLVHARAPLVCFLDADDMLLPHALETMLKAYVESGGKYIYSGWLRLDEGGRWDGPYEIHDHMPEFDVPRWIEGMQHPVTCLVPADKARAVGGFDEKMEAWEDWDFYIKLALAGVCGHKVDQPLMIYRSALGGRRQAGKAHEAELLALLHDRYAAAREGEIPMGCCNGNGPALQLASATLEEMLGLAAPVAAPAEGAQTVRLEFIGEQIGAQSFVGRPSGRIYRAGRETNSRYHDADPRDVPYLVESLGLFRIVPPPKPDPGTIAPVDESAPKGRGRRR